MNIFKKIFSLIAAVILFGKCGVIGYVGAEEAPHDIKLTCETKYIDINEIPEDRMVKLAVSIDNNPGFQALCVLTNINSRLKYNSDKACEIPPNREDIGCVNYLSPENSTGEIQFDIFYGAHVDNISLNSDVIYLKVLLPDHVDIGDFFNVDILKESESYATSICLNLEGEAYGPDSFSELNCGGIHITGNESIQEPVPVQHDNVNHTDENSNNEQKPSDNTNSEVANPKISNEVTTVTSSLVTTTAVSSSQTTITTKPQTSAVTTVTTKKTEPVTVVTTEQFKTNSDENNTSKKGINVIWFIIAAVTIIVIGGSVFILIKRSKKDK